MRRKTTGQLKPLKPLKKPGPPRPRAHTTLSLAQRLHLRRRYKPLSRLQQQKAKLYRKLHKQRRKIHIPTAHDMIRELYKQSGATAVFQFRRIHATDLQRLLIANKLPRELNDFMSAKQILVEKAALTGLHPGRTALTLPERLVIGWLESNNYSFGGVAPNITNPHADFFSQYPLGGGRASFGGGLVADVFISAGASKTDKGIVLAVDGAYYHSKQAISGRDDAQNLLVASQGYVVSRIRDNVVYNAGQLDGFMHTLLPGK